MAVDDELKQTRLKVILVCGPWGSGTSLIAGALAHLGAFGLGPYFKTNDPNTPNSYESVVFRDMIRSKIGDPSQPHFSFTAPIPDIQFALRALRQRIEQHEFGLYEPSFAKPIFLKQPLSAYIIPQICDVFDTKLIYVMRPLEDIDRTRLRRNWLPNYGAVGASHIYKEMGAVLERHSYPTITLNYKDFLISPTTHVEIIARFAGLDPSPAELQHAVDFVRKPSGSQGNR